MQNEEIKTVNQYTELTPVDKKSETTPKIEMDDSRLDRLRSLTRGKELIGHLLAQEETELAELLVEFKIAYNKYIDALASTPPTPVSFDASVECYRDEDVAVWKRGTKDYVGFRENLQTSNLLEQFEGVFNSVDKNNLKALSLKEKPLMYLETVISEELIPVLHSFGLDTSGSYIFDRSQIEQAYVKNRELFEQNNFFTVDQVIHALDNKNATNQNIDSVIGLLFGYPTESVQHYSSGFNNEATATVNVYGITWFDFNNSMESKIKQERLRNAFELSGILTT